MHKVIYIVLYSPIIFKINIFSFNLLNGLPSKTLIYFYETSCVIITALLLHPYDMTKTFIPKFLKY